MFVLCSRIVWVFFFLYVVCMFISFFELSRFERNILVDIFCEKMSYILKEDRFILEFYCCIYIIINKYFGYNDVEDYLIYLFWGRGVLKFKSCLLVLCFNICN